MVAWGHGSEGLKSRGVCALNDVQGKKALAPHTDRGQQTRPQIVC